MAVYADMPLSSRGSGSHRFLSVFLADNVAVQPLYNLLWRQIGQILEGLHSRQQQLSIWIAHVQASARHAEAGEMGSAPRASDAHAGSIRGGMGKLPAMPLPPYIDPEPGGGCRTSSGCAATPGLAARIAPLAEAANGSMRVADTPLADEDAAETLGMPDGAAADVLLVCPGDRAAAELPYSTTLLTSPAQGGSDPVGASARHETARAPPRDGSGALSARLQLGSDSATAAQACWACVDASHVSTDGDASVDGQTGRDR